MAQANSLEKTGKTVEEAVRAALVEWSVQEGDVEVQILEEPSKGFLGLIGTRPARVLVTLKPDPLRDGVRFIEDVFQAMGVQAEIIPEWKDNVLQICFQGEDMGILIGRRGDTLDALQYLVNLVVNRQPGIERTRIILDVENYRQRREETLVRLAKRLAEKVRRTGKRIVLEPMSPQERRIIHTTLHGDQRIATYSEGEEPFRKVVVASKTDYRRQRGDHGPGRAAEPRGNRIVKSQPFRELEPEK